MEKTIGIFDSGVGGLTVLRELRSQHPSLNYLYLGDTARVPYGTRSKETVVHYSLQDAKFLEKAGVDMIIVACHTASAYALDTLKNKFSIPVMGVLKTSVDEAIRISNGNPIGIIGTDGTINSNAYQNELKSLDPKIKVFARSCPLFVPVAEEGMNDDDIAMMVAKKYLNEFKGKISTLILGCTHYPLLKKAIQNAVGNDVKLVDPAEILAKKITFKNETSKKSTLRLCVTDIPQRFTEIAERFLGAHLPTVEKVDVESIKI